MPIDLEERYQKMADQIISQTKAYSDKKLDDLARDIDKVHLEKMRKEFNEQFEQFKKDVTKIRDFTGAAGGQPDKWAKARQYINLISEDQAIPEAMGASVKGWSPELIRGIAGFGASAYAKDHPGSPSVPSNISKALAEGTLATGGAFVPVEFKPELLKLLIEGQVVRPRARIFPMQTDTMLIPRIVDTTHASTIHGGVAGTWTAEAGTISQKDPATGQVQLIAKKFSDYVLVSNELIKDSPIAIAPLLAGLLREGLGFFEDVSAISGNGVGQMLGFTSSPALISVTRATTSHIKYADVVTMYSRMFPSSHNNAVWVCSPAAWVDIAQMALAVGTGGSAVWITNYTTAQGAPPATIFGRPLIISEKIPTLGTANDIVYCDFSYYLMGDRMSMELTTSEHVAFASDQTAFRIIERLDGQPWIASALTPNNGGNTLSAFVGLAA